MKITVTGSLGNISKPLTQALVAKGHQVTVVTSSPEKADEITALGAIPAVGSVEDQAFLNKAFSGADVVYTMIPPNFVAPNVREFMLRVGKNYAEAIKNAGVKKVVNLSSVGAHLPKGTGPIAGLHDEEQTFARLEDVDITHLRAGFFYVNFLHNIDMVKNAGMLGSNYGGNTQIVMTHPKDIAKAAEAAIERPFSGKNVEYVVSDKRPLAEVATVLGKAVGKPELPWVEFTDEDALTGMLQSGMPREMASRYVEMGNAVRNGSLFAHFNEENPAITGKTKLEDFAKDFAAAYSA